MKRNVTITTLPRTGLSLYLYCTDRVPFMICDLHPLCTLGVEHHTTYE